MAEPWRNVLQCMIGPETWVQINVSGPFRKADYEGLCEFVTLLGRHAGPDVEPARPSQDVGDLEGQG